MRLRRSQKRRWSWQVGDGERSFFASENRSTATTHYRSEKLILADPKLKLNGTGRQLRLFAVDRWDSGLYMCSTSLTEEPHHNVTVTVKGPPVVTAPRHGDRDAGFVARQVRGHPAKLRCKVSSILKSAGYAPFELETRQLKDTIFALLVSPRDI